MQPCQVWSGGLLHPPRCGGLYVSTDTPRRPPCSSGVLGPRSPGAHMGHSQPPAQPPSPPAASDLTEATVASGGSALTVLPLAFEPASPPRGKKSPHPWLLKALLKLQRPGPFHTMPSLQLLPQSAAHRPTSFSSHRLLSPLCSLDKQDLKFSKESPVPGHVLTSPPSSGPCLTSARTSPSQLPPSLLQALPAPPPPGTRSSAYFLDSSFFCPCSPGGPHFSRPSMGQVLLHGSLSLDQLQSETGPEKTQVRVF